jgi:hypothetical protein
MTCGHADIRYCQIGAKYALDLKSSKVTPEAPLMPERLFALDSPMLDCINVIDFQAHERKSRYGIARKRNEKADLAFWTNEPIHDLSMGSADPEYTAPDNDCA